MVAPKERILTMPLRQGPRFKPLPSAKTKPALTVVSEIRRWFKNVAGETYANEVLIPASGAWASPLVAPPAPLVEALRLTLPSPEPIALTIHVWVNEQGRFRRQARFAAEIESALALYDQMFGRVMIEWGVGKARNWTYVDAAPGSLQIPNASWLAVSGWSHSLPYILAATAQVGYTQGPSNATWTFMLQDSVPALSGRFPPPYGRDITGYFVSPGLAGVGKISLADGVGSNFQEFLMRPAITPNPAVIPYPPVSVPMGGHVFFVGNEIVNAGGGSSFVSSIVNVRV